SDMSRTRKSAHSFPPSGRDHPLPPRAARPRAPRPRPASGRVQADRIAAWDPERRYSGEAQRSRHQGEDNSPFMAAGRIDDEAGQERPKHRGDARGGEEGAEDRAEA